MNCQKVREQLDAALDGRAVVSGQTDVARNAAVVAHADSCPDCRVLYDEYLLIESALTVWAPRRPSVDLTDRVIDAARREGLVSSTVSAVRVNAAGVKVDGAVPRADRLTSGNEPVVRAATEETPAAGRSVWPTVVTVALVLAAIAIVFREKPGSIAHHEKTPQPSVRDSPPGLLDTPQDQVADIGHLVADAQSAWRGITSRVSRQASGFSVFVPNLSNELGIADVIGSADDNSGSASPGDDDQRQETVQPSAVDKAFEFLFDKAEPAGTLTI
tara:strand:+ start:201634 stop:202452 length:819 start_codon:yes stop_codon:yes gene_type:complete